MPTYSAEQIRRAEQPYLDASVPLMARASAAVASVAFDLLDWSSPLGAPRVLVLAGSGNNGGDALWAGAALADDGAYVVAVLTSDQSHEEATAAAGASGVLFVTPEVFAGLDLVALPFDIVIDGILGTGTSINPALRGVAREVVEKVLGDLNAAETQVVAVDIPSGLQPDTGQSDAVVLPAAVTVTLGGVKQGLTTQAGCGLVGRLVLADIGIGDELAQETPAGQTPVDRVIEAAELV